jgi:hypothetical protein
MALPDRMSGRQTRPKVFSRFPGWRSLCLLGLFAAGLAEARSASFDRSVELGPHTLEKRGEAPFQWYFLKLYDAALYLPAELPSADALGESPRKLVIAYHRAIPVDKIIEAGDRLLARNTPPEVLEELRPDLERLNAAYVSPRKGDRYALHYLPGEGTTLSLNDKALAFIPGDRFAAYYFRIWLGEEPVGIDFRDTLLGRG